MTRRPSHLAAALLVALLATGCAGLPVQGPVEVVEEPAAPSSAAPFDFDPPAPEPGAEPAQVVAGFLRALQATPASTAAAVDYLTAEAAASWRPDRGTTVYDGLRTRVSGSAVTVALDGAFSLDAHGRWLGRAGPEGEPQVVRFRLRREDGEWRITDPPDAIVIPRSHFSTRYRSYSLFFFDPSGSVLVPEPVYLPWGPQATTELVNGLLAGPPGRTRDLVRSYFPRGTRLGVSVPVSDGGVAEVPLSSEVLELNDAAMQLMAAQLAWTLRQVPDVRSVTVTVDGAPVEVQGGRDSVPVSGWGDYDPAVAEASTDLFGLRPGAVIQVVGDTVTEAAPLVGPGLRRARSLGVDMTGQRFAAVTRDGRRAVVLTRSPDAEQLSEHGGVDLLRPMWDRTGRLWLLDRRAAGADVRVVGDEGELRLALGGLGDRTVVAAALSRDGSRLGLLARGRSGAQVLVARVVRDGRGRPVRLTRAEAVSTPAPLRGVRDLGWRDHTTLAVLTRPSATTSEIVLAAADGASDAVGLAQTPDLLFDEGVGVAASPGGPQELLVTTATGRLHELALTGRWDLDAGPEGLRAPTFVG